MRKKIQQMSEGKFDIQKPDVAISVDSLEMSVKEDGILEGEFRVFSTNEVPVKGIILSTHPHMILLSDPNFIEQEYAVRYRFQGLHCEEGQKEIGQFICITDGGEFTVPYQIIIQAKDIKTSLGEMNELKQFGELAKEQKEEALRLFSSAEFEQVFLKKDKRLRLLYQALKESRSIAQAMEEFLVHMHKKVALHLSLKSPYLEITREQEYYEVEVERNGSGYVGAILETNGTYFTLEKEILQEQDFEDNIATIGVHVSERSRSIHNWESMITMYCGNQTIEIPVRYDAGKEGEQERERLRQKREWKKSMISLYESWFLYHTNQLEEEEYKNRERKYALEIQESEEGRKMPIPEDYYAHFLNRIPEEVGDDLEKRKKVFLKLYESGFHSPFLYYEMIKDMNEEVELLSTLGNAELAALRWGQRYEFVSMRLLDHFMQLLAHQKQFSKKVFRLAEHFYKQKPLKEYLSILCGNLIKGDRVERKYHKYYEKGVQESIKMIGLCEGFIRSMDFEQYGFIPRSVLLHFIDAYPLPDTEREYLFANILYNEKEYDGILYQYGEKIQSFLKEQMKKGRMNQNLFYLYRENFEQILLSDEMLTTLPSILFKRKLICHHPLITGAIIYHQETRKVDYVPFVNHIAYIDLYTENYQIILLDKLGRRYADSIPYELQTLFEDGRYIRNCYNHNKSHSMLLYRMAGHTLKYKQSDARAINIAKEVLNLSDIDEDFYWQLLKKIIVYYYEHYEGQLLEEYLQKVKLKAYDANDRNRLIEYMITRRMYDKVIQAIKMYGYRGISPKKILHLVTDLLKGHIEQEDMLLLELCLYAFRAHQYELQSLEYIGKYAISSLKEMIAIWNTAFKHSLRIPELEENILAQSLFEEEILEELFPIFSSFYERNEQHILTRAFLKYVSYDRFRKEKICPKEFYRTLKIAILEKQILDDFSKMALLHYLSGQEELEEDIRPWVQKNIQEFLIRGMSMPFFREFKQVTLPEELSIYTTICWRGEKGRYYYVQYELKADGEVRKEKAREVRMKEVMQGIYTVDLVIFHREEIDYSIWERQESSDCMLKTGTLYSERKIVQDTKNRFDALNLLVSRKESQGEIFVELAKDYMKKTQLLSSEWTLL